MTDFDDQILVQDEAGAPTPLQQANHLIELWRDHVIARSHLRELSNFRAAPDISGAMSQNQREKWLGTEAEIRDALSVQKSTLKSRLAEWETLSPEDQRTVPAEKRLEVQKIQLIVIRTQELDHVRDEERDHDRSE